MKESNINLYKGRVYYFDNLKAILIILVVIGHFIDTMTSKSHLLQTLFLFIYTFHMPLFIFTSGYFSRNSVNDKAKFFDKIILYIVLYTIFKFSIFIFNIYILNKNVKFRYFNEGGVPWYLFAMIIWNIMLYYIKDIKKNYFIILNLIIALLIGYDSSISDYFVLSRIIVFAPFFYFGFFIDKKYIDKIININLKYKIISVIFLTVTFIVMYSFNNEIYKLRGFFTGRHPYDALGYIYSGAFLRVMCYIITIFISWCILYIVPSKKTIISKLGNRTLQIYILHTFIYRAFKEYKMQDILLERSIWWKLWIIIISIVIAYLLSLDFFKIIFDKIRDVSLKFSRKITEYR